MRSKRFAVSDEFPLRSKRFAVSDEFPLRSKRFAVSALELSTPRQSHAILLIESRRSE